MPDQNALKQIDRWIDAHKKDLVDLSCLLVSIDTTVPPGRNYPKISQLLAGELKDIGITPSVSYIPEATIRRRVSPEVGLKGPRPNTFATLKGEGEGPKILLNGHVDVVPADPSGWSNDPFKPVVKNGKIYGRGSADIGLRCLPDLLAQSPGRDERKVPGQHHADLHNRRGGGRVQWSQLSHRQARDHEGHGLLSLN